MRTCILNKYKDNYKLYSILKKVEPKTTNRKIYILNQLCYNEFKRFGIEFSNLCDAVTDTVGYFY